ncbi:RING finger and WD repeat domain-containing protein 3, partial [Coemansia sp. RSA 2424]
MSDTAGDTSGVGYRRPPAPLASTSGGGGGRGGTVAQTSRLQRASESRSSYMSIVDDGEAQTETDDSDNDFAPQRRPTVPRAISSSLSANTTSIAEAEEAGDSSTCPICFEGWTISGGHRLASLKCGHLFGRSCIRKWLSQKQNSSSHQQQSVRAGGGKSCCPECKQPATLRDVRILFARSVTAVDGARLEDLRAENKRLATELSAVRGDSAEYKIKHQQMLNEVKRLRTELDAAFEKSQWMQMENSNLASRIAELSAATTLKGPSPGSFDYDNEAEEKEDPDLHHQAPSDAAAYVPRMRLRATVAVAAEAGRSSRVLAFDPHCAVIYASHSQAAQHQHTMALIDVHNPSRTPSLVSPHLHGMEIRGAEVSPVHTQGGARYLLTASHDQTAALTALGADGTRAAPKLAARLALGAPAWSCAWDAHDGHLCYVGTAGCA